MNKKKLSLTPKLYLGKGTIVALTTGNEKHIAGGAAPGTIFASKVNCVEHELTLEWGVEGCRVLFSIQFDCRRG